MCFFNFALRTSLALFPFIVAGTCLMATSVRSQSTREPLGPSSRRTPVAISEIMAQPANRPDGRNTEYIELYNSNPWPEDISGYRLEGLVQFTFPARTAIAGRGFIVVAATPTDVQTVYGLPQVFGPYTNRLKGDAVVRLYDEQGAKLLDVSFSDAAPWPMGVDGTGHSLVLARPSFGESDPQAWDRSDATGGSPGTAETIQTNVLRNVVLNEILAQADPSDDASIELYNHSTVSVNLSGCTLSDDPVENRFLIPTNTVIAPHGFVYFTEAQLDFRLKAAGETVYFKNSGGSRVLDALRFEAQEQGISYGRYLDGAAEWYRLRSRTFGTNNSPPLLSKVGINEIMYHPLSGLDDDQYVELFNHGTNAVDLSGWKFVAGIKFTVPTNTVLAAQGFLVIGRNTSRLLTNYPQLNPANTIGNFNGKLSGAGERLALAMPHTIVSTNAAGVVVTNLMDVVVDEVTYGTGGRWGRWSDGGGSSLELLDARADKRRAANWADSDETAKAPWATIETTGVLDHGGLYGGRISFAQLGLLDAGECLVDDIEVRPDKSGENYVANPGFESGLTGVYCVGDHTRSSLDTHTGYPAGGNALHVRTADCIQVGPNGVEVTLTNTSLAAGQTATLRFKARWLRGCPEPLLRLRGAFLEATGRLPVPANLGTPGLPNSQATTNAGPAIDQVTHTPTLPAINQPVVVAARVSDPDGLASLTLRYRVDPDATVTEAGMNDAGTNGDSVAGDGVFSTTLPGQAARKLVAFVIVATDARGAASRFPELVNDNTPVRECAVLFGDASPTNLFGTYHLWLTEANERRWATMPVLSNEDIDGTLVYGDRVIYNMGGRYSGSPWHQNYNSPSGSAACHYVWTMPKDDRLLGTTSFNKIHWPGNDIQNDSNAHLYDDPTLQREQAAYLFLRGVGAPWSYRRFVAVYVNGVRRGQLMEDALRPNGSTVQDQYFPEDRNAQFYKLQPWYEFSTFSYASFVNRSWCLLAPYTTTGGAWKTARYRLNWALRKTPGSLSDFTNVYNLVTAANAHRQSNYVDLIEKEVDVENWMRVAAANHAAGNWDCFGSLSGQNVAAWVSPQHRWTLFTIDFSIALDNRLARVGLFSTLDPAWQRILATPKFRRLYCRALNELTSGVMQPQTINPVLDAKYAAFVAAGLSVTSPASTEAWIANARSSIISQLAPVNATPFKLRGSEFTTSSNAVTLTGLAPVKVVTLRVNGQAFTPTWTSVTNWSLVVPAPSGTNAWSVGAFDRAGNAVGVTTRVTVKNPVRPN